MKKARPEHSAETVSIVRDIKDAICLLRPDEDLNNAIGYCLAVYGPEHACDLYGVVTLVTSLHLEFMDRNGERSDFQRNACARIGQIRKDQLDREYGIWDNRLPDLTVLPTKEDMIQSLLDTWTAPIRAGLTISLERFPGFHIAPWHWEKSQTFYRPSFLSDDFPEQMTLVPPRPPGFEDEPLEDVVEFFEKELLAAEWKARKQRASKIYLGAKHLCALDPESRVVSSWDVWRERQRARKEGRAAKRQLTHAHQRERGRSRVPLDSPKFRVVRKYLRDWTKDHEFCRLYWVGGYRDTEFPPGTNYLRRICRVNLARSDTRPPTVWASAA